jgi:hypothetical protein
LNPIGYHKSSVQTQNHSGSSLPEEAGYFEVPGAYIYTVLHRVPDPLARVLLVGPFASERHNSYIPWLRWARYLAERRIEVLRYDYRGIGESTGVFEEMTFENWCEDVRMLADWCRSQSPHAPLVIHGLELGAILAGIAFDSGVGDVLLLWAPPADANQALRSTLSRRVGMDQLFKYGDERKSLADYIVQLEQDFPLDVEGYQWSGKLWRDSFRFQLPKRISEKGPDAQVMTKPVKIVPLGKNAAPLVKGGAVGHDEMKDFSWLFAPNFEWIAGVLAAFTQGR